MASDPKTYIRNLARDAVKYKAALNRCVREIEVQHGGEDIDGLEDLIEVYTGLGVDLSDGNLDELTEEILKLIESQDQDNDPIIDIGRRLHEAIAE